MGQPFFDSTAGYDFGSALYRMRHGQRVKRKHWSLYILITGDSIVTNHGAEWQPKAEDLLADDWSTIPP